MAAVDYFLRIDFTAPGPVGETTDSQHKGEIEIQSFSWGVTQTSVGTAGGGAGAGRAVFQDIHFTAQSSKASPRLMLACAQGEHINKAVLTGRRGGQGQQEFLTFTLSDAIVSSYKVGDPAPDVGDELKIQPGPADSFSLNFSKVEFALNGQKAGWDVKANKLT
jgi:type VI secretion system secreted protein Hcp